MKEREHRDAGNASGFGVSTRCARSPLRFDPSDDTPNPEAWKFVMAGRGLPAMTDRLLTTKSRGDSGMRLTSIQPAGNYRLSRAQNQSEYTLFSPSDCPTNQDHLKVLINFMFDFVSRFSHRDDENIDLSLNEILGGPGWRKRLDPELSQGLAVEKLFRETLKASGRFRSVVSAKIERATMDRTHFSIMYATKQLAGLKVFRDTEYKALQFHSRNRATAQERRREERTGISDMFADDHATVKEISIDEFVEKQAETASATLLEFLERHGEVRFERILAEMLEEYMLRETNVKDICVKLAKAGKIENTWGKGNRKPRDASIIRLIALASTGH